MTLFTRVTIPGNDELDRLYKDYREAKDALSRYLSCETVEAIKEATNGEDTASSN